ncbi:hypothetical protein GCM10020218_093070 [Dactylosporangium vinaceum]
MATADVAVDWQVSATDTFATLVASGTFTARYAAAHSVHVIAAGLQPDAEYSYRFRAQGHISPVGRNPHRTPRRARSAGTSSWRSPRARTTSPGTTPPTAAWPTTAPT